MDMSVWYLVGAILVFFMQCGFAAVEAGFTRAKNAGNIIMKNLMDFCIGTVVFVALGCGVQKGRTEYYRGVPLSMNLLPKLQSDNTTNFCTTPPEGGRGGTSH